MKTCDILVKNCRVLNADMSISDECSVVIDQSWIKEIGATVDLFCHSVGFGSNDHELGYMGQNSGNHLLVALPHLVKSGLPVGERVRPCDDYSALGLPFGRKPYLLYVRFRLACRSRRGYRAIRHSR